MPHRIRIPDPCQKFVQSCLRENVHRDNDFWFDLSEDLDHVVLVQRPTPSTGTLTTSIAPRSARWDCVSVWCKWPRWAMHRSAISNTKNRGAVVTGATELPHIRRHIVDPHVGLFEPMACNSAARIPSAQDVFDARLYRIAAMRRMRIV